MSNPVKKFSAGGIQVAVWKNEGTTNGEKTEFNTVSIDRRYKDKSGEWKSSNNLKINDIPKAILALEEAFRYLALKEPLTNISEA